MAFRDGSLFLGIGNQAWPAAHAALVATVAHGRERDTALAGARALRNAALGVGALLATACMAGGTTALRALAAVTALAYLAAAALAWSVHVHAHPAEAAPAKDRDDEPAPRMLALLAANVIYVFCLNVPRSRSSGPGDATPRVPGVAGSRLRLQHALVVTLQVPVTVLMSRFSRRTVLALSRRGAGRVLLAS